jgi:tRNA A-37 threonylcarbamoyl transferase component Bud32/Flp pilus assembly protein TadD
MRYARGPFRRARLSGLVACVLLAFAAQSRAGASLAVARAHADPVLAPIASGFDRWLEGALRGSGLELVPIPVLGTDALGVAAQRGAARALVPRLREQDGRVELRLSAYETATGELVAASRAEASLDALGSACTEAVGALARELGHSMADATPPEVSDLASTTRSLDLAAKGQLLGAWRAVQGKLSPLAMSQRDALVARVRKTGDPETERARVLAASGDPVAAWALVGNDARRAIEERTPEPALLTAAAEIQLSLGKPDLALRFLAAAEPHAPDSADIQIAIARARLAQGDRDAARAAAQRAAEIASDDPQAADLMIEIDADRPAELAADWLDAGNRAARRLDPDLARRQWKRAAEIDRALAPTSAVQLGDLETRLGRPVEALAAYREAQSAGVRSPELLTAIGRAQRRSGDAAGAERSLRQAIAIAPRHGPALTELGVMFTDSNRAAEAVPLLRTAQQIEADPGGNLMLARALRLTGANADAIEVLATGGTTTDVRALRELAHSQQASGDLEAARSTLQRAVALEPDDASLREQLAGVLDAVADAVGAAGQRALAARLASAGGAADSLSARTERQGDFDAVIASFAAGVSHANRLPAALIGVREPSDWRARLRRFARPRVPDVGRIEAAIRASITARFARPPETGSNLSALAKRIDGLYAFDRPDSLSADAIASVNSVLGTEAVFVARLVADLEDHPDIACQPGTFAIETRFLSGSEPQYVQIFGATECVAADSPAWVTWNYEAFAAYALFALVVLFPVIRGWGTVVVRIGLPEKTKGYFSIHITKRSDQVAQERVDKKTGKEKIRSKRRLDFLRRFEQHMVGRECTFRWIPARRSDYTITVGGPLLDATGKEIIGHFLQEQKIRVRRGAHTNVDFDFRPRECAVEVKVNEDGRPVSSARVAVAGDRSSLRYARDGVAYLYLGRGDYTILVGSKDTVAAFSVRIERLDAAIPLHVDLAECEPIFRGCAAAVEPYLVGDHASAAEALHAAGNRDAARRLRAGLLERAGRSRDAATELEALGDLTQAAELRASDDDHSASASLYEQSGNLAQAAAAHRAAGEWAEAARCYEEIYDYGNALECWREHGDESRQLDLLEKLGEYQDAAQMARGMGDLDRAIRNFQLIDARHPDYRHVCRQIAEIVSERGDHELAVAKFSEALGAQGLDSASLDVLESFAEILVRAGKREQAVSTYEVIQRRDVQRTDLTTRIQSLRREIDSAATRRPGAGDPESVESRYELLQEIGRGGMGVVYKARDKRLGRVVALKRLPDNLREHPTAVELFEREARAAAALNHRNIVTIFDAGQENGTYFISMELLEGRALNDILARRGKLSARDTARIGVQIAAGLHYAHERKIVHRDIKTANLFFTKDQLVKIMDFGIAKSLEEVRRSTTVVGGTPYYMAPEQARGQGVDHRADLYAFGVTLFQLATGALPFSDGDVAYLHAHEPAPDPREIDAAIPAELAALILRMMAKAPAERPANAAEVAEALRTIA